MATIGLIVLAFAAGCQSNDEGALLVVISLPDQRIPLANKTTLVVGYAGAGARVLSEGGRPACTFTLLGVDGEFADDHQSTLTIHANGTRASRGPADIAACRMKASDETATAAELASRLTVRFETAEDAAGKPIDLTATASTRHAGGGDSGGAWLSEEELVQAQAEAVKGAATIAKTVREDAEAATTLDGKGPQSATSAGGPRTATASPGAAKPPPAVATGSIARAGSSSLPGGSTPEVVDNRAMPEGDRDPGYDDSPADDDRVSSYSLDFFVQTAGNFGALQLDIYHLGNSGGFIGREDKVDCVSLVREAMVASNYVGERLTKIGLISLNGVNTPAEIMRCGFRTREHVSPGSFLIEVADASDTASNQIEPPPTVVISSVMPRR